jgi:hypothetical protein
MAIMTSELTTMSYGPPACASARGAAIKAPIEASSFPKPRRVVAAGASGDVIRRV